ncbi:MAG: thioredoxin-dependent thiol peroxidase, partial [Brevibacterium aurantiacum]
MPRLSVGDTAPDFTLSNQDGKSVTLSEFKGQRVVVYFYPAAMTPGCTTEACDFRDSLSALSAAGLVVLGISPDKPEKLKKFAEKEGLNFDLLSDPDKSMMEEWGAFGEKKNYGKVVQGVIRSTLVIDA